MWQIMLSKLFFCNSCHMRVLLLVTNMTSTKVIALLKSPKDRKRNWKMMFDILVLIYNNVFSEQKKTWNYEKCGREVKHMIQATSICYVAFHFHRCCILPSSTKSNKQREKKENKSLVFGHYPLGKHMLHTIFIKDDLCNWQESGLGYCHELESARNYGSISLSNIIYR